MDKLNWSEVAVEIRAMQKEHSGLEAFTVDEILRHFDRVAAGIKHSSSGIPSPKED